jgi:two-component system, NarL family, nitrate/nitrite response regulator NarL
LAHYAQAGFFSKLLEQGQRLIDVAKSLVLSENTVKTHLRRIYDKLGVDNRHDAVSRARLTGQLNQPA